MAKNHKPAAKSSASVAPKSSEKTKAVIKVPQALASLISTMTDATAKVDSALRSQEQSWVKIADYLSENYDERDDAAEVLKAATEKWEKPDLYKSSIRSNILSLAFPGENAENLKQAKADKLPTQKLVRAARGGLKKSKKGEWIKVEKKAKNRQGGSNRKTPIQTLEDAFQAAILAAKTAKISALQVLNTCISVLKDCEFAKVNEAIEEAAK